MYRFVSDVSQRTIASFRHISDAADFLLTHSYYKMYGNRVVFWNPSTNRIHHELLSYFKKKNTLESNIFLSRLDI